VKISSEVGDGATVNIYLPRKMRSGGALEATVRKLATPLERAKGSNSASLTWCVCPKFAGKLSD
jgi:hypothetical protein